MYYDAHCCILQASLICAIDQKTYENDLILIIHIVNDNNSLSNISNIISINNSSANNIIRIVNSFLRTYMVGYCIPNAWYMCILHRMA